MGNGLDEFSLISKPFLKVVTTDFLSKAKGALNETAQDLDQTIQCFNERMNTAKFSDCTKLEMAMTTTGVQVQLQPPRIS